MDKLQAISVDDEPHNLALLEELAFSINLDIHSFINPLDALEYAKENFIDFAFVDYMMPQMNGIEFIGEIRKLHSDIPIIMITAVSKNREIKLAAIKAGATEFLLKPIELPDFIARVNNLCDLRTAQIMLKDRAKHLESEIENAIKNAIEREKETLHILGKAADSKDPETSEHIMRVSHYSKLIAEGLGKDEEFIDIIFNSAPLHDIGKLGVPDHILLKPGKLTNEEFETIKKHSMHGYEILKEASSKYLVAGKIISLSHHEKYSGEGYPEGIAGEEIPLIGRIVAIADVFDALTTERPYKKEWPIEKAFEFIESEKGKHFDPEIAEVFLNSKDKVIEIFNKIQG